MDCAGTRKTPVLKSDPETIKASADWLGSCIGHAAVDSVFGGTSDWFDGVWREGQ